MDLRQAVAKYLELAGGYGKPAPLAGFGLSQGETEKIFSAFDEDYHISRYFHFSKSAGVTFLINGFAHTDVTIDPEIQEIL